MTENHPYKSKQYYLCRMGFYETSWIMVGKHAYRKQSDASFDGWFSLYMGFSGLE